MSFLLDCVARFFTGYVEGSEQRLVMTRAKVARRYVRGEFLLDAVTAVPFFVGGAAARAGNASHSPLLMLKMIKIVTAHDDIHVFQHLVDLGYALPRGACGVASRRLSSLDVSGRGKIVV